MTIDEFIIRIGLDPSELKKGIAQVQQAVGQMANNVKSKLSSMVSGVKTKMSSLADGIGNVVSAFAPKAMEMILRLIHAVGLAAVASFGLFIKDAHELGQTAKDIGVTVDTLSALENAVTSAGNSTKDLEKDMKALAEETGGDAYGALKELAALAEEMGEAEYVNYAEEMGFSRATIDLTKDGTQAFKDHIHAAKELGIITKEDARLVDDYVRAMREMFMAFRGVTNIVFRMILPMFTKVTEAMKSALLFLRQNENYVKMFFTVLAAVITTVAIPALLSLAAAMLSNPITWFIVGIAALAMALEDMFGWMDGKDAEFADFWAELWGTSDPTEAKQKFEDLKNTVAEFFEEIQSFLPDAVTAWEMFRTAIHLSLLPIRKLIEDLRNTKQVFEELYDLMKPGIDAIKDGFLSLGDAIKDVFGSALDWAKEKWNSTIGQLELPSFGGGDKKAAHAEGGIFTSPHVGLVAEDGAEAIIPLSPKKRNRGLELLSKIAGSFMPNNNEQNFEMPQISLPSFEMPKIPAAQALPMGGATTNNNITTDTRVNVGTVNINAENGTDAANQFMSGIENRAQLWTAAANVAY